MLDAVAWTALGVAGTLLAGLIAHKTGRTQISLARESHRLSVSKAVPKIGTSVTIDERYDNGRNNPAFLYLTTTIYNEGELSISELNGYWKLSASYGLANRTIPIQRDFLGSEPYELQSYRIAESGASDQARNQFRFNIDIEFDYLGFPDDQSHKYSATYTYDYNSRQMIKN